MAGIRAQPKVCSRSAIANVVMKSLFQIGFHQPACLPNLEKHGHVYFRRQIRTELRRPAELSRGRGEVYVYLRRLMIRR